MDNNLESLSELQLDVFREIGNIGSGSAAAALSKIVEKRITLSLPKVKIMKFDEITHVVGGEETQVLGILQPMHGDLTGNIMFLLGLKEAHDLVSLLMHRMLHITKPSAELDVFEEMELSALREVGNIMISSYLSAISALTNLKIMSAVPQISLDMAAAILSVLAIEYGKNGDHVLYISSEFTQDKIKIGGDFFLVPEISSLNTLLKALGVN